VVVRLAAPPVDQVANTELVERLARSLDLPRSSVSLVGGAAPRTRRVHLDGLTRDAALRKLGLS
jgi:uncharacterized protein YggU (UPF0235/DUF167 family)